jgi:2-C-methyl-D-erythritol 4-phosphate cytidylyltransferase
MSGVWAVVPAAGTSSRMRNSLHEDAVSSMSSKIFLALDEDRSVLHESLQRLYDSGIRNLCIPSRKELFDLIIQVANDVGVWDQLEVIEGGSTRFQSVRNGLGRISDKNPKVVVIHDAARPFAIPGLISETIASAFSGSAAILGNPVSSTIKIVSEDRIISETPERTLLWEAQTPQTFPFMLLYEAFEKTPESLALLYDDASVFEQAGGRVTVIESPAENIKVTTARDLALARILYAEYRQGPLHETKSRS